jgi:hypothetical protein
MDIIKLCETPGILRALMILGYILQIVTIIVPIIIIITLISSAFKTVISGKEEDLKNMLPTAFKKIVAGLVIFLLPSILKFAFSLTGETFYELNTCMTNATPEKIKYYETLLPVEYKLQNAENNPTESNIAKAREAILGVTNYATEDTMLDYLQRLSVAETNATKYEDIRKCESKGGSYNNGYCYIPTPLIVKDEEEENTTGPGSSYNPSQSSGGMVESDLLNGQYYVISPGVSVKSYLNTISSHRIAQNNDPSKYGDKCLSFAYMHAYSLYSGDTSGRVPAAANYAHASEFSGYDNDNKQDVLQKVYNELVNGRPCIIQVNGNKAGTSRHYVTVVGFKNTVSSANELTEDDLLIIDSYDGRLESMDTEKSRFMVTGAACHKKYSGYQMYYLK